MKALVPWPRRNLGSFVLTIFLFLSPSAFAATLLPFPLSANQRGTVTCLDTVGLRYDVYLPPGYSTNGTPLPILYTLDPSGGGMVQYFRTVCSNLNIIVIGLIGPANGRGWEPVIRETYAVSSDIRRRVLFDPTAELVGGFSGGAESSYVFSRCRAQHVAGVFAMGGWLGRSPVAYYSTDRVLTNLLVARTTGTNESGGDIGASYYLNSDSNFLASCGAVVQDWFFPGEHWLPPDSMKSECLSWLLSQRIPAGPDDRANAAAQASEWQSRVALGEREAVLRECVAALMEHPRSWLALEAQLVLDDLMSANDSFRFLPVENLAQGDFAYDQFYYLARGAADAFHWSKYHSALKALTGVVGASGDRAGDLRTLLVQYGYWPPSLNVSTDPDSGRMKLWVTKDTPGLVYLVQWRTNFVEGDWQFIGLPTQHTNTTWSAEFERPPADNGLYRMRVGTATATSPPWPQ